LFGEVCANDGRHAFDIEASANYEKKFRDEERLEREYLIERREAGLDVSATTANVSSISKEEGLERTDEKLLYHSNSNNGCSSSVQAKNDENDLQHMTNGLTPSNLYPPTTKHDPPVDPEKSVSLTITSFIEDEMEGNADDNDGDDTDEEGIQRAKDTVLGVNGSSWHTLSKTLSFNNNWRYKPEEEL